MCSKTELTLILWSFAVVCNFCSAISTKTLGPLCTCPAPRGPITTNRAMGFMWDIVQHMPCLNFSILLGSAFLACGLIRYKTNVLISDSDMLKVWQPRYHCCSCTKFLLSLHTQYTHAVLHRDSTTMSWQTYQLYFYLYIDIYTVWYSLHTLFSVNIACGPRLCCLPALHLICTSIRPAITDHSLFQQFTVLLIALWQMTFPTTKSPQPPAQPHSPHTFNIETVSTLAVVWLYNHNTLKTHSPQLLCLHDQHCYIVFDSHLFPHSTMQFLSLLLMTLAPCSLSSMVSSLSP